MDLLVSVIIPIYNGEKFVYRCVDSLICQTYKCIEVILVDDGSKDSSSNICDEYSAKDPRIKVIHKQNEGVSAARNDGIAAATGEFIVFLDVDDWIENDYLESLIKYSDYPLVVTGYQEFGQTEKKRGPHVSKEINVVTDLPELWNDASRSYWWFVWGKLFRHDVIKDNHLMFKQGMIYLEDYCFVLEYLSCIDNLYMHTSNKIHHLIEAKKYSKYRMNFLEFIKHMEIHDNCFKKLEKKCHCEFLPMRERISFRHFYNFLLFLMFSDIPFLKRFSDAKSYKENMRKDLFKHVRLFGMRAKVYWGWWKFLIIVSSPFTIFTKKKN